MKRFFKAILTPKNSLILVLLASCLLSIRLHAKTEPVPTPPASQAIPILDEKSEYTVNFDNVSILEIIKFVSKIGKKNFVYDESQLTFNVSMISEEPTTLENIMTACIQVLKANGFELTEQNETLIITKNSSIKSVPPIVSEDIPLDAPSNPLIMTYVFNVKNTNPSTLAGLIRPLLSPNAIIEVSEASRRVIVTDLTQNIREIYKLFASLDIPKASLSNDSFPCQNNTPNELINLVNQILLPISEGNPLIFVPQESTQTIFIISTPFLVNQAIETLKDLDSPPSLSRKIQGSIKSNNILIYHIKDKPADLLMQGLTHIAQNLKTIGPPSQNLVTAIDSMKFIKQNHSLFFIGDSQSLIELKDILNNLDIPYSTNELEHMKSGFYVYTIKNGSEPEISIALNKFIKTLQNTEHPNTDLIETIKSMQYIKENHSLMFTGDPKSLDHLQHLLPTFDHTNSLPTTIKNTEFFIYHPQHTSSEEVLKKIKSTLITLKRTHLANPPLLESLNSATLSENKTSITFTGTPSSIQSVQHLLQKLDLPDQPIETLTYPLHDQSWDYLKENLYNIAKAYPPNSPIIQIINKMQYIKTSNTIVFQGSKEGLQKIQSLLDLLKNTFNNTKDYETFIYPVTHTSFTHIEEGLNNIAKLYPTNSPFHQLISSLKYVKDSNIIIFKGSNKAIDKLKPILNTLKQNHTSSQEEHFIYSIKHLSEQQLKKGLNNMVKAYPGNQALNQTIDHMRYVSESHSLIFKGSQISLDEIKTMLTHLDIPEHSILTPKSSDFYVFQPTEMSGDQFKTRVLNTAQKMQASNLDDPMLISALESVKLISNNTAVIFTGTKDSIEKLKPILQTLNIHKPDKPNTTEFFIYHPQHTSSEEVLKKIKSTLITLKRTHLANPPLLKSLNSATLSENKTSITFTGTPSSIQSVQHLLQKLDLPDQPIETLTYPLHDQSWDYLKENLYNIAKAYPPNSPIIQIINKMQYIKTSNTIVFQGSKEGLQKIQSLLDLLKNTFNNTKNYETFIYPVTHTSFTHIEEGLNNIAKLYPTNSPFHQLISSLKYVKDSNIIIFKGSNKAIDKLKPILNTLKQNHTTSQEEHFIYSIKHLSEQQLKKGLNNMVKAYPGNQALNQTIDHMRYVSESHSLIFKGSQISLDEIKTMLTHLDIPEHSILTPKSSDFYVFQPTEMSGDQFKTRVLNTAQKMQASNLDDPMLISALESVKLISNNTAVIFTGTKDSIEKLKPILQTLNIHKPDKPNTTDFFIYKPTFISATVLKNELLKGADQFINSGLKDSELIHTMESAKLSANKESLIFTGTPDSIGKVKSIAHQYDHQNQPSKTSEYFIFKPEYQSPENIIEQSKHAASQMETKGLANKHLIEALRSATVVSQGTGVLYTGTAQAITQIKSLTQTFDIQTPQVSKKDQFFVYTPTNVSPSTLIKNAEKVAKDMISSGFSDQSLMHTLQHCRIVSSKKSVLFTGTTQSIEQLKNLIPSLDHSSSQSKPIHKETIFKVYNIKHLTGPILIEHLKNMASDLEQLDSSDTNLIKTLNNIRYLRDTNSIMLTGTPSAVSKAIEITEKFDIPSMTKSSKKPRSGYLIYKSKYGNGKELVQVLKDFEQNLRMAGVNDPELFDVINNLKWMNKNASILISGNNADTKKVFELLERFDLPTLTVTDTQPSIETISDTSFLIYKLQYHSGSEIQRAINLIGEDLGKTNANKSLAETIQTLQWIEITNSLIATGKPESLQQVKELIKNIDIPLKQVFVEILVIETDNTDSLDFGLRWGAQGKYRNKLGFGGYNEPLPGSGLEGFNHSVQQITGSNTPTGQMIPIASGGDLGVIGDLVLHKGQSYLALGSLITAIKADADATIVMNQKVITQDNKMSTIFSGRNIPYAGSLVTNSQGNQTVNTANLEYRDVGISLSITPVVGDNDIITLTVEQDISETVGPAGDVSASNINGITTTKNSTKVVVSVPDQSFLVLSGSIQDSKQRNKTGIPCLGGLPFIGAAFSETRYTHSVSNIVFFIKPQIIKSFDVYSKITENQEDIFRDLTKEAEDFDVGLELLKTPDDTY